MLVHEICAPAIEAAGDTHVGLVRKENQDRHAAFASPFGQVHIVADGMGGHSGGATAAQMVVDGYRTALCALPPTVGYREALRKATQQTNEDIGSLGSSGKPEYAGMGSTVVIALIQDGQMVVAHVGDSRAYLHREGGIQRLTKDHTAVQHLVDRGLISEADAKHHPHASLLVRALGQLSELEIDIAEPVRLRDGDTVMLCSDGLSGRAEDSEIEEHLRQPNRDAIGLVRGLIQLALSHGGTDNVTVRCLCVGAKQRKSWFRRLFNGA